MRRLSLFLIFSAALAVPAAARTLDYGDLRAIVNVGEPQLSPDGRRIVYVKSLADFKKDRYESEIMLLDVRSGAQRPLTLERHGIGMPRWSPDGARLAFLAHAGSGKDEHEQIFLMRMDGGDARPATRFDQDVQTYSWSPDGRTFAVVVRDKNPYQKQIDAHLDAFEVENNDYLHESAAIPSHLWTVDIASGKTRRLTSGAFSLGLVDPDGSSNLSWSPGGDKIAFVRFPTPLIGDALGGVINFVDVRTGKIEKLTSNSGLESSPQFAPAGGAISYIRNTHGDPTNGTAVYVLNGGKTTDIRASIDRSTDQAIWAADGEAMWFTAATGTRSGLWYIPLHASPRPVNLGPLSIATLGNTARNGAMTLVANTPSHPGEVYVLDGPKSTPRRLTNLNPRFDSLQLGRVTALSWKSTKGNFHPNGVLTYPPNFTRGKKYPLVLMIHGGPQSASIASWSSRRQLFASHGYLVFEPNYRGSTNLGDAYERAITFDAGDGPGQDVMSGLAAVERLGIVDTARIGVSGWSYGGYMTSWLIGHYHPWKVAMSGAALNDWFDDYNVSFYVSLDVPFFGGPPGNPKYTKMWIEQSPLTYASQVTTPTLILGDIGDNNVTITNSFKMYHALKDNHVLVEFVAYPVHGHFPDDPVRSEDVGRRWLTWLDKYLK
ncbi:MAG: S9 family peptidase [Candidatus Eremiobacteraeota bacterium]|nr:S9 family peptidase [Candidatus Eremiobacteraeota bacterium]